MQAAAQGLLECTELLVMRGADVDAHDLVGNTPLHWAAEVRSCETNLCATKKHCA